MSRNMSVCPLEAYTSLHFLPQAFTLLCIQQYHGLLINLSTWLIELMPFKSVKVIKNQKSAFGSLAFRLKGDVQGFCFLSFKRKPVFSPRLITSHKKHTRHYGVFCKLKKKQKYSRKCHRKLQQLHLISHK